jgi:hypothetical protein
MKNTTAALALAITLTAAPNAAIAFNTGGHFTATKTGLNNAGFSPSAIKYAQVANYQVDFWTNHLPAATLGRNVTVIGYAQYFHFDDLPDAKWVVREFAWHENIARYAVEKAVRANRPRDVLIALGITLHATQDFYAHSTMADVDWTRWMGKPVVLFETLPDDIRLNPKLKIRTGVATPEDFHVFLAGAAGQPAACRGANPPNGCWPRHFKETEATEDTPDQCSGDTRIEICGVNKDAYQRRWHFAAREMAALSTQHWANKYERWVNNAAFWARVKAYAGDEIEGCWDRAHGQSVYAGQWGRWKYATAGSTEGIGAASETLNFSCSDTWQDETFNDVFVDMYRHVDPPTFAVPSRGAVAATSFVGTYDIAWGSLSGVLTLRADGAFRTGTWVIGNAAAKTVRRAKPDGNAFDVAIDNGPTGRIFLNGANGLAGFIRLSTADQRPTGFSAVKRPR